MDFAMLRIKLITMPAAPAHLPSISLKQLESATKKALGGRVEIEAYEDLGAVEKKSMSRRRHARMRKLHKMRTRQITAGKVLDIRAWAKSVTRRRA